MIYQLAAFVVFSLFALAGGITWVAEFVRTRADREDLFISHRRIAELGPPHWFENRVRP